METGIKDQYEGEFHKIKGRFREMVGKITDNPRLETKGIAEKIAGKVREKIGLVKKVFGK